jgi:hypothetical protein
LFDEKNRRSKISWHSPFKLRISVMVMIFFALWNSARMKTLLFKWICSVFLH